MAVLLALSLKIVRADGSVQRGRVDDVVLSDVWKQGAHVLSVVVELDQQLPVESGPNSNSSIFSS